MTGLAWPPAGPSPAGGQWLHSVLAIGDVIAVAGVSGNVTITTERPPYRIEAYPTAIETVPVEQARQRPGRLLLAHQQVVPFTGRHEDLQALAGWMGRPGGVSVRLVHAAGGQGKTRLAAYVAQACTEIGWAVWRVLYEPVFSGGYRMDMPAGGGLLVVIDYADRWPVSHLLALVTHLKSMNLQTGVTVRLLMLARSTAAWWPTLRNRLRSAHQVEATAQPLPALGEQVDRAELYRQARHRFAAAMQVDGTDQLPLPSTLAEDAFGQALTIHMAALVAVDAHHRGTSPPSRPHALSSYLLLREYDHWYGLHHQVAEPRKTPPEVMGRAVYLATLTAAVGRATASTLLQQVGLTEPGVTTIIDDHRFCYPPDDQRTVLQALHPDRLGEDLIALSTPGHPYTDDEDAWASDDWAATAPEFLLTHTDTRSSAWAAHAVTVLVETARRWKHIRTDVLYPLLRQLPDLALAAGGATLTRLAELSDIDPDVLEAIDTVLPAGRHIDFDIAAATITDRLTPVRLAATTDLADHARLQTMLAWRLANAGRKSEAVAPSQEAVTIRRRLAEDNATSHLFNLAAALHNLSVTLGELGRWDEALPPSREAVELCRKLAETDAVTYLPDLAPALTSLGDILAGLGRWDDALPPSREAVDLCRTLAKVNPAAYLPYLAAASHNLGLRLVKLGRREEAPAAAGEAVEVYRRLAEADPAAYLPELATALHSLGTVLVAQGRWEEALTAVSEAVEVYRRLAEANPAAYLPLLANALTSLGNRLAELGRSDEALRPSREAVEIHKRLTAAEPAAYLLGLAAALSSLGNRLAELGRREEALPYGQEAVAIHRQLAAANPAYVADLAQALHNLSIWSAELGRWEEALTPSQEAHDLYRKLAESNPAIYRLDLARVLSGFALVRAQGGHELPAALAALEEGVAIFEEFAEAFPHLVAAPLWGSYQTMADVLDGLGRGAEAAELRRQLDEAFGE